MVVSWLCFVAIECFTMADSAYSVVFSWLVNILASHGYDMRVDTEALQKMRNEDV